MGTADLSLKRNLGLLLARAAGWQRVLYLDDDILQARKDDVSFAAGLLDEFRFVGLRNNGFPDNSVVCHAYRAVGGLQDTFIGGGAMLVRTDRTQSFFPNIYNEDWFFMLGDGPLRGAPVTGHVVQKRYDPFANPARARAEELGDCLAEGLYWLLDEGHSVIDADSGYWQGFLDRRRVFLDSVLDKLRRNRRRGSRRNAMIASIQAARNASMGISPRLCVEYMHAWRQDLGQWQVHLEKVRRTDSIEENLWDLGLAGRAYQFGNSTRALTAW